MRSIMKNIYVLLFISTLIVSGCTEESPIIPDNDLLVVRAYLYADEPVDDVQIGLTFPLDYEYETSPVVNDALITLIRDNQRFELISSPGDNGYYHYAGDDLTVSVGDEYSIEVEYSDQLATAQTVVPEAPTEVSLSSNLLVVPDFSNITPGERPEFEDFSFTVYWNNESNEFCYLSIDNLESNPVEIDVPFAGKFGRFISQPVRADSFVVSVGMVTHLGTHSLTLYRVNQEYADMYQFREQDSRDLNEPLTNIENGLGIFSAFNSARLNFEVEME
jgi:Domain of unknown function (DUF4249)